MEGDIAENMRQVFLPVLMVTNTIVYAIVSLIMSAFGAFLVNLRRNNANKNKDNKDSNIKQQK